MIVPTIAKTKCSVTPRILKGSRINQNINKKKNTANPIGQQQAIRQNTRKKINNVFIVV